MTDLQATLDLVSATRRLMAHAATSAAGPDQLRRAREAIDAVVADLGTPNPRMHRVTLDEGAAERVRAGEVWRMFPHNPMAYPLQIAIDGRRAHAELVPGALLEGPPDYVHGGFSAHLLDALLGTLVQVAVRPAYTAQLDLTFRRPTLLDVPTTVEGVIDEVDGRKIRATGWICHHGERTMEARGLFAVPATANGASDHDQ